MFTMDNRQAKSHSSKIKIYYSGLYPVLQLFNCCIQLSVSSQLAQHNCLVEWFDLLKCDHVHVYYLISFLTQNQKHLEWLPIAVLCWAAFACSINSVHISHVHSIDFKN